MIRFHKEGYKIISITFIIAIAIILGAEKIFHTTLAIKITQVLTLGFVVLILNFFNVFITIIKPTFFSVIMYNFNSYFIKV